MTTQRARSFVSKYALTALCCGVALIIVATLLRVNQGNSDGDGRGFPFGWDASNVCAAVTAAESGKNPYYVDNLAQELSRLTFPYAPFFLDVFAPLCSAHVSLWRDRVWLYPAIAGLAGMLLIAQTMRGLPIWRSLACLCMVFGGLAGFQWTFQTGNIQLFSGFLLALSIACLSVERESREQKSGEFWRESILYLGAFSLGLSASIKLLSLPMVFGVMLLPDSRRLRLRLLLVAVGAFGTVMALSFELHRDFVAAYEGVLRGSIPGQSAPVNDTYNLSIYQFAKFVPSLVLEDKTGQACMSIFIEIIILAILFFSFMKNIRNERLNISFYFLMIISSEIRLKEYSFFDVSIILSSIMLHVESSFVVVLLIFDVGLPLVTQQPRLGGGSVLFGLDQTICLVVSSVILASARTFNTVALKAPARTAPDARPGDGRAASDTGARRMKWRGR